MQYGRSGLVGGFDSPLVHCRSVFSCVWACVFWVSPVGLLWINWVFVFRPHSRSVDFSWINYAFVLFFRSYECIACVYRFFECAFGPTVAWWIFQMYSKKGLLKRAILLLLFATTRSSVSVLVHIPHASFALLRALSGPLSSTACVFRSFRFPPGPLSRGLLNFPRRAGISGSSFQ